MEVEGRGVQSIVVGGRLLKVMADAGRPLMLRDIAAGARITPAQAHAYLVSYRKLDLVEVMSAKIPTGRVSYVHRDEDPRDYKVSFEKIKKRLGYEPEMRVPDGVEEIMLPWRSTI